MCPGIQRGRPEAGRKAGGPNVVAWGAGGSWAMMGIVAGGGRMEEAVKVESSWSDRVIEVADQVMAAHRFVRRPWLCIVLF